MNKENRSFGRIRGRNINQNKLNFLNNILPKYQIIIENNQLKNYPKNDQTTFFEIGFGYGEHTIHKAILYPNVNFIACETYINGIISILDKIEKNNLKNVFIYNQDARILLEQIQDNSIDKFFILFPDPWPKKKQNKRRIINDNFINLLVKKLKKNGKLLFSSDIIDYIEWTINIIHNKLKFNFDINNLENCKTEPKDWITTRYQNKAIKEGRECYFLEFIKE